MWKYEEFSFQLVLRSGHKNLIGRRLKEIMANNFFL